MGQQSRQNHYVFAHRVLPNLAHHDALQVFEILSSEKAQTFLWNVWRDLTQKIKDSVPAEATPADFHIYRVRLRNYPAAVIVTPPPEGITETHMVAVVWLMDLGAGGLPDDPAVRYFTLEKGARSEDGGERTVLGEWTKDGSHLNFGDGPPAEPKAFARRLEELVQQ
ncbi:MAG: hypothetical protein M5U26_02970 [Planctomycetota bacterium]|nr:hypothetical protein [Planctomycetota bacterium]